MTHTYKILGQVDPLATTETDLYVVPAYKSTVVSTIQFCNRGAAPLLVRVSVSQAGAATANKDFQRYDLQIDGNDAYEIRAGITLGSTDVVRVYTDIATLSVSIFGDEMTP